MNTLKTKISVIIPLFNKREHIIRTVQSVLSQRYRAEEIIIVDDGSTDDGAALVAKQHWPGVRLLHQANQGVSVARNCGVKAAKYEIVAFIDADDTWESHHLSEINNLVNGFQEAQSFATNYQFIDDDTYINPRLSSLEIVNGRGLLLHYFKMAAQHDLPFMMSSFAIKRRFFLEIGGFARGEVIGEDQALFAKAVMKGQLAYSASVSAFYHLDSANRACEQTIPSEECAFSRQIYYQAVHNVHDDQLKAEMIDYTAGHLLHIAALNIKVGRYDDAKRIFKDPRCKRQFMRYLYWVMRCYFPIKQQYFVD